MNIAICDDDERQIALLNGYIRSWAAHKQVEVSVTGFESAEALLFGPGPLSKFDFLLLDIQMGKTSGVELARLIRDHDSDVPIAFVTGNSAHMREGYRLGVLDYLVKPYTEAECHECLDRAYRQVANNLDNSLFITAEGHTRRYDMHELCFFQAEARHIKVHTTNGPVMLAKKMADLETELPADRFTRIHRSTIVNVEHILDFGTDTVIMDDGTILRMGKSYILSANAAYIRHQMK